MEITVSNREVVTETNLSYEHARPGYKRTNADTNLEKFYLLQTAFSR